LTIVAAAIKEHVKDGEVVFNLVPKENAMSDIYCQLIPNDDPKQPFYEVVPRIGAFELSFNGVVRYQITKSHFHFYLTYIYVIASLFKNAV